MARPGKRGTVRNALIDARSALKDARIWSGWLDAEVLLAHVMSQERSWLHAHPEHPLTATQRRRFRDLVSRRGAYAPVAYLIGEREFYGHTLRVSPAVLIPRPDTELLVEQAIAWLRDHPHARRVIDLGTGSGAIAIVIARGAPSVRVVAIDTDPRALRLAAVNVAEQRVAARVRLKRGDLLRGASPADLITANLPYLSAAQLRSGGPELEYEPRRALDGGKDGLDVIRRAIEQAPAVIRPGGCLLFECDPRQARRIEQLAQKTWPSPTVTIHKDLAGRDRVVRIEV
ncbi:MAG TPA: peptide chain release factor N(5)-glutamine methyltransferase [Candidatus Dormibacteraeota bacterium]|nr:peptide chain release factor N(5)-glutamine methyltransferase [Candidatus Dormibacteraeota bacterium]